MLEEGPPSARTRSDLILLFLLLLPVLRAVAQAQDRRTLLFSLLLLLRLTILEDHLVDLLRELLGGLLGAIVGIRAAHATVLLLPLLGCGAAAGFALGDGTRCAVDIFVQFIAGEVLAAAALPPSASCRSFVAPILFRRRFNCDPSFASAAAPLLRFEIGTLLGAFLKPFLAAPIDARVPPRGAPIPPSPDAAGSAQREQHGGQGVPLLVPPLRHHPRRVGGVRILLTPIQLEA
mmetsp:Transcript_38050/g.113637  ORF Transcript_38050/g.113637 Transcript_38050/m.113637 type:complete len:234 (+) Transcript_38050:310-1011(+)